MADIVGHTFRCVLNGGDYDTREVQAVNVLDQIVMPDHDVSLNGIGSRHHYNLSRGDDGQPLRDVSGRLLYQWSWRTDEPPVAQRGVPAHRTSPEQAPRPRPTSSAYP